MLIAQCPIAGLNPPEHLRRCDAEAIETSWANLAHDADVWLTCTQALPHIDPSYKGRTILSLTVESGLHEVGDARLLCQTEGGTPVLPGSLFVIDPMTPHWLLDGRAAVGDGPVTRWIGLQWEVEADEAIERARQIVAQLGGTWLPTLDQRYASWAPNK
jgi:hypothetical protein